MAYQYDELGNVIGEFETEEERRQREEAAKQLAHKVEVKTYGDGRQVQTTTQQIPAPVAAPVSPDTFARMQQAESGNRDYDAQGRPIVSPAGAMFRNQVMPSTAAQPGYGIRPAASQTPEEYNRVGQEYYQAMLKKFGGNEQAAAAAYNAGPGTVERNMAANQGQLNVAQLPQETQGYLGKIGQAVTNMFPSAQAGTVPASQFQQPPTITPVAPGAAPAAAPEVQPQGPVSPDQLSQYSLATGQTGLGIQPPGGYTANTPAQTGVPVTTTSAINTYQAAQDNPGELMKLRYDENAPEFIRERAGQRAYELMDQEMKKKEAEKQATALIAASATGDRKAANDIAKTLTSSEGSWVKMILLGFLSPQLAGEEAIKLGFGNKWAPAQDANGNQGLIEYNARGMPIRGVKADNTPMTEKELVTYATGGQGKVTTSGTFFQTPDGRILRAQSDEQGRTRLVDAATGAKYTGTTQGLTKLEEAGALRKMDRGLVIDLAKKHGQNVLEAEKEYVAINGPFKTPEERQQFRQVYGYDLAQPAPVAGVAGYPGGAAAPAAPVAPTAPAAAAPSGAGLSQAQKAAQNLPGAAPSAITKPIAQQQAEQKGREKAEAVVGEDIGKLRANQPKAEKSADYLITKIDQLINHPGFETSVGAQGASYLFGMLDKPLPPQLGGGDARDWAARFKEVQGQQFLQAIETMRGTGAISEREGQEAKAAISRMSTSQTEKEFRDAAADFQNIVRRGIDTTREKLGQQPKYNVAPESELAGAGAEMSPADKARAELERRRKAK